MHEPRDIDIGGMIGYIPLRNGEFLRMKHVLSPLSLSAPTHPLHHTPNATPLTASFRYLFKWCFHGLSDSVVDHRSIAPGFKPQPDYVRMVFHPSFCLVLLSFLQGKHREC